MLHSAVVPDPPLEYFNLPDGARVAYTVPPTPPAEAMLTLLFIHGAGGHWTTWEPQVRAFTREGYAPVAVNLPGHGDVEGRGRTSVAAYAADVEALLEHLAPHRLVVCGHSLGGAVALQLVLNRRLPMLAGLVLACTGARFVVAPKVMNRVAEDWDQAMESYADACLGPEAPPNVRVEVMCAFHDVSTTTMTGDLQACAEFNVIARLPIIRLPTRIIAGTNDRIASPELSRELSVGLPNGALLWAQGSGHFAPLEKADTVNAVIQDLARAIGC